MPATRAIDSSRTHWSPPDAEAQRKARTLRRIEEKHRSRPIGSFSRARIGPSDPARLRTNSAPPLLCGNRSFAVFAPSRENVLSWKPSGSTVRARDQKEKRIEAPTGMVFADIPFATFAPLRVRLFYLPSRIVTLSRVCNIADTGISQLTTCHM